MKNGARVQCHGSATFSAAAWAAGGFPHRFRSVKHRPIEGEGALGCQVFYNPSYHTGNQGKRKPPERLENHNSGCFGSHCLVNHSICYDNNGNRHPSRPFLLIKEPMNMTRRTSLDNPDVNLMQRVWRSVFPSPVRPRTERDRKRFLRGNLILHFRPPTVKEKTLIFTLSWGLGGMAATLVLLQMATGILLKFIYVPTPVDAYTSVQSIMVQVPFRPARSQSAPLVCQPSRGCPDAAYAAGLFHRCLSSPQAV